MLTFWSALFEVALAEVRGLVRRPLEWVTGIVLPVFWVVLVGSIFSEGLMQGLPVAVVNLDAGAEAQRVVSVFESIPSIEPVSYPSPAAADRALKAGRVYASILIPAHYTEKTATGEGEPLSIAINKSYYAIGTILEVDLKLALADIKRERAAEALTKLRQGTLAATAEHLRVEEPDILFEGNPAFNFNRYLVATLVPGLLALGLAITVAGVLVREWRDGSAGELLKLARNSPAAAALGKLLPWVSIYSLIAAAWVAYFGGFAGWSVAGSLGLWLTASVVLMAAAASIVLFVTSLSLTWVIAMTGAVAVFAPTFPFTAFSYPFEAMTPGATFFGNLLPLTHYLAIQGQCMVLDSPPDHTLSSIGVLGLFVILPLAAGVPLYAWRLRLWAQKEKSRPQRPAEHTDGWTYSKIFFSTLRRVSLSRDTFVVALVAVGFYLVFYAWPYSNQQIEHIPTVVLDLDQSSSSRRFVSDLDASPTVKLLGVLANPAEADDLYRREVTSVVVTIPSGFETALARGENTTVHIRANGAFPVKGRAVQSAVSGLVTDSGRKLAAAGVYLSGMPPEVLGREDRLTAADAEIIYRFNEIGGYGNYTVPVVAPVILQAIMLMLVTFSVGAWLTRPKSCGFIGLALTYPARLGSAVFAAFWLIALLWFGYMQGFDFTMNEYGSMENAPGVLLAGLLFTADIVAMSLLIGLVVGTNHYSTQTIVMFSAPAVFISGAIWPAENITTLATEVFAHLLPSTPGIRSIVALSQDGATIAAVSPYLAEMALQTLLYLVLAGLWARARAK